MFIYGLSKISIIIYSNHTTAHHSYPMFVGYIPVLGYVTTRHTQETGEGKGKNLITCDPFQ